MKWLTSGALEGGFAMSETDATMPVNASWLCYPGNKNIGGNPLYHEMAHSLQHIIFESMNDLEFYELLPDLIDQAYERKIVQKDFPAGQCVRRSFVPGRCGPCKPCTRDICQAAIGHSR